jgi:ribonuclease P protein component
MERFTFHKEERLCSRKIIGDLFTSGESFLVYPFKIVFLKTRLPEEVPAQVAFSVSKRNFKRAVRRNLLKRRMREAYRLNKPGFYRELTAKDCHLALMFVYVGKDIPEYSLIGKSMISALKKIVDKI